MAVYECDWSRHRYPQAQQSIYYTLALGSVATTYACRLCPKHFRESQILIRENMASIDDESQASVTCDLCENPREQVIYAKVYAAKEEAQYFAADFCGPHGSALGQDLHMFNGRAL